MPSKHIQPQNRTPSPSKTQTSDSSRSHTRSESPNRRSESPNKRSDSRRKERSQSHKREKSPHRTDNKSPEKSRQQIRDLSPTRSDSECDTSLSNTSADEREHDYQHFYRRQLSKIQEVAEEESSMLSRIALKGTEFLSQRRISSPFQMINFEEKEDKREENPRFQTNSPDPISEM